MPRGVYPRKPRSDAPKPDAAGGKPKRTYKRRAQAETDVKVLALEAFTGAADNLAQTVRDVVDMDDAPELASALRTFEICSKIYGAV